MTEIRLTTEPAAKCAARALIVLATVENGEVCPRVVPHALNRSATKRIAADATALLSNADRGLIKIPSPRTISAAITLVCVVDEEESDEGIRRTIGAALARTKDLDTVAVICPNSSTGTVDALAQGALLGSYRFAPYRREGTDPAGPAPSRIFLIVADDAPRLDPTVARAATIAESVGIARDLVNTPANHLGPSDLASRTERILAGSAVSVKSYDTAALRKGRFGGILAVGQGSSRGPRLVRLRYRHPDARQHVALVGKGVTFDSGGLSIKPPKPMESMKADMAGAACVLATMRVASILRLPINVTGWLAVAENMPGGQAQRPGDVITIRGGKTVEVLNTDAEGRLVLADAIVRAGEDSPDLMIDVATLTGAQVVALGARIGGLMGNDEQLRSDVLAAAEAAGEDLWPMPLPTELRASLDSPVADLANVGERKGGMLTAAIFLREFVPGSIPWAHLDIAGPGFNEGPGYGYTPRGATGFGVRTLVALLERKSNSAGPE